MKEGWQIKTLNEVCVVERGSSPRPIKSYFTTNPDGVNWIKIGDTEQDGRYVYSTAQKITPEGAKQSRFVKEGDFILTNSMSFGRPYIMKTSGYIHDGWFVFRLKDSLDTDYFYHLLSSPLVQNQFASLASGAIVKNISGDLVKKTKLPIPPLPEQQRIVAILDDAFESIAIAKANAEKNLQNAKALFESYLQGVFSQGGEGWKKSRLVDFTVTVSTGPFGSLLHKSDYVSDGVPLVNPINIIDNYIVPNESKQISDATKARLQSYILQESDIVIARRGEIGRCAVVTAKEAGWICGTGCFFIRPLPTTDSRFLANLIRSVDYRKKLEEVSSGATMLNLSNKSLCDLEVIMPSFEEQKSILQKLDLLSEETQRLESLYQQKITALDELKKALLHQAFSGQL